MAERNFFWSGTNLRGIQPETYFTRKITSQTETKKRGPRMAYWHSLLKGASRACAWVKVDNGGGRFEFSPAAP